MSTDTRPTEQSTLAKTDHFNLRVSAEERAEIEQRASSAGMSLTAYVVASALGRLTDPAQLDRIEAAIGRVEARLGS